MNKLKFEKLDKTALDNPLNELADTLREEYNRRVDSVTRELESIYEENNGEINFNEFYGTIKYYGLIQVIKSKFNELNGINETNLQPFFENVYDDGFEGFKDILGVDINKDLEKRTQALERPIAGATTSERLEKHNNDLQFGSVAATIGSIQDGNNYIQTKGLLKDEVEKDYNKTMNIAETKGHKLIEQSKLNAAEQSVGDITVEVELMEIWVSVGDEKVRAAHDTLNGTKIPVDEDFISPAGGKGPAPGLMNNAGDDINCRCWLNYESV